MNYNYNYSKIANNVDNSVIKRTTIFLFLFIISIFFLGIGYAQVSDVELYINGTVSAPIAKEVIITDVSYVSGNLTDPSLSIINETYLTLMNSKIVLGNDLSSTITYKIKVKNNSEVPATYVEALYSSELGYDNLDIVFTINGITFGDVLAPDEEKEFTITFKYKDGLSSITNNELNSYINFKFDEEDSVAKIGTTYYTTLQSAINAVPKNNTETTIVLLKDLSENVEVSKNQNIKLNLNNNELSNDGNSPVISNYGTLNIINGNIYSNATGNGAINNESTGVIVIDGIRIECVGGKQAFYNNKGVSTIKGNAYLSATTTERAAAQNVAGGTMTILGGIIKSTGSNGLQNGGTLTIGVKDGDVQTNSPEIIGIDYGINSNTNYNFYNGTAYGRTAGLNSDTYVTDTETGYELATADENMGGIKYRTAYLAQNVKVVTFNPNSGTVSERTRKVEMGHVIGTLPSPSRNGYDFDGWFDGDTEINPSTIINNDITFSAHWTKIHDVARINNTYYDSLQSAITAAPNNTETTIVLLKDTSEAITVTNTKNIIIDLDGKTLSNKGNKAVFENSGILSITNGTVTSSTNTATINNNDGILSISTNVTATGSRQAVYIVGGTVRILDGAYLTSKASGVPTNSTLGRATIQCLSGGNLEIYGGTIIGTVQQAISNEGIVTIGVKDGSSNSSAPIIRGETYGIVSVSTLNFYDGAIYGITDAVSGTISDNDTGIQNGTEIINGKTYKKQFNN